MPEPFAVWLALHRGRQIYLFSGFKARQVACENENFSFDAGALPDAVGGVSVGGVNRDLAVEWRRGWESGRSPAVEHGDGFDVGGLWKHVDGLQADGGVTVQQHFQVAGE